MNRWFHQTENKEKRNSMTNRQQRRQHQNTCNDKWRSERKRKQIVISIENFRTKIAHGNTSQAKNRRRGELNKVEEEFLFIFYRIRADIQSTLGRQQFFSLLALSRRQTINKWLITVHVEANTMFEIWSSEMSFDDWMKCHQQHRSQINKNK